MTRWNIQSVISGDNSNVWSRVIEESKEKLWWTAPHGSISPMDLMTLIGCYHSFHAVFNHLMLMCTSKLAGFSPSPLQQHAPRCCYPTATTCHTLRPCSPVFWATGAARRRSWAPSTCSSAWWSLCWEESATLTSGCWAAPCWRRTARATGRCCPVAPLATPCTQDAATPLRPSTWNGPTSSTAIASFPLMRSTVMIPWRDSKVSYPAWLSFFHWSVKVLKHPGLLKIEGFRCGDRTCSCAGHKNRNPTWISLVALT